MYIENIEYINIELSTLCNVKCSMCARYKDGDTSTPNPDLPLINLSLSAFKKIINQFDLNLLKHITFCGNLGDPVINLEIKDILRYTLKKTNAFITIHTNGSFKTQQWWSDFGDSLRDRGKIFFAIDGLEDTHHLYRKGANFEKVIQNATAFIKNGGMADCDFIVFEHNQHQIADVMMLAEKVGFSSIKIKKTTRFNSRKYGDLKPPTIDIQYGKTVFKNQPKKINNNHIDLSIKENINCYFKNQHGLYISANQKVWPCCHLTDDFQFTTDINKRLYKEYGEEFNSLRTHTLKEIANHSFFKHDLEKSWEDISTTYKNCQRTCGVK